MMTASIFSFALAAGYTLFMFLIRCDASKIADIDLSIFGDASMKATKHQKGALAGMLLFIIKATIISFGSLIDSPITNFFAKIGVYGWLFAILAIMMIVRVDGKRLLDINSATRNGSYDDCIFFDRISFCRWNRNELRNDDYRCYDFQPNWFLSKIS